MLKSLNHICGYEIQTLDDTLGSVKDFLFDDLMWTVRYVEVDSGQWLPGRRVLIATQEVAEPDWSEQLLPVKLTRDQLKESPGIDEHQTVSRTQETQLVNYFGWAPYWQAGFLGFEPVPLIPAIDPRVDAATETKPTVQERIRNDCHLRSVKEVINYHIKATDGEIGHVEDLIADTNDWAIRYFVVDTRNWLPGRKVLIAPEWCTRIQWKSCQVHLDLTKEQVKASPEFNPEAPINRELEVRLYDYYGRPAYW